MKSIACISSSVRAACHTSTYSTLNRAAVRCSSVGNCPNVDFTSKSLVVQHQPCVTGARSLHVMRVNTSPVQQVNVATLPTQIARAEKRGDELTVYRFVRQMPPKAASGLALHLPPCTKPQENASAPVKIQSLFEGDVIPELCSRLADYPSNDRAEGLAILLEACVEFGLEAHSPLLLILMKECMELLSSRDITVAQLCRLGEVAHTLEGGRSEAGSLMTEVLDSISAALEEDVISPSEAVRVYYLLSQCYDPTSQQQTLLLSTLHRHTQGMVHRLNASQVSDILQLLLKLQQQEAISLVLRLSQRAAHVFKTFTDNEIIKVLSALMILGQHHDRLLAAMERHLPGSLSKRDPEVISTVMEYCLQTKCRSERIFEAVAENFMSHAENHTTPQIVTQIVAMGRLKYLPQCSSHLFKKLETILSERFCQFQPRSLIEMLHACIHLERFPLNHLTKVFSPYFLQSLQAQGEPMDKKVKGQLTQLHLSTSLECNYYWGPKLPFFLHAKKFSSVDEAFETPMESLMYKQVKGPLKQLLGGRFYLVRVMTSSGYTVDVEICLDEEGNVLSFSQLDKTYKRLALFLDGENRFCSNTHHLLGKEATKRRHLRGMGFEVVQIPYFEYEELQTQQDQMQYLKNKIFPPSSSSTTDLRLTRCF